MIPLASPPIVFGDNVLEASVRSTQGESKADIVIDEFEVTIVPGWRLVR